MEGASANFRMQYSKTVLHFAADYNKPSAIQALIVGGAALETLSDTS